MAEVRFVIPKPALTSIPLELRHSIFKYAAARPDGTRKVLRRWFEKKDVKEKIDKMKVKNPDIAYVAVYGDENPYFGPMDYTSGSDDGVDDDEDDEADYPGDDDDQSDDDEDDDEDEEDNEVDEDTGVKDVTMENAPEPKLVTEPVIPNTKWRHITKFLTISGTPPPLELLLTSKELSEQAMAWFYNVAFISIDVSGSMAHTSMFEEALDQIADAELSPFKKIRHIKLKFVWDTEWMRSEQAKDNEDIFKSLLDIRADLVTKILESCPELKKLTIEWHDSVQDPLSDAHRLDIYDKFKTFAVDLTTKEHFLTPGTKPSSKSDIGKKRREFQTISDGGFSLF